MNIKLELGKLTNDKSAINDDDQMISLERLYDTMSKEVDGLYRQMITICTAFLGGTLVFFEKLFVSNAEWSIYVLFGGWAALTYPLAVLIFIRWQNVEAHRHVLEYLKTGKEKEYNEAVLMSRRGRKWTTSAIISMVAGLVLVAAFTAINIFNRSIGD
jgi:hypothetical protein